MRLAKQLAYGITFLCVLALIAWGVYGLYFSAAPTCFDEKKNQGETDVDCGGSCIPCEVKHAQPLSITYTRLFNAGDGVGAIAEIQNKNIDLGAQQFTYSFSFIDTLGSVAHTFSGNSFLYPGEVKYLVIPKISQSPSSTTNVFATTSDVVWVAASQFVKPSIDIQNSNTQKQDFLRVSGRVVNQTASLFGAPTVSALLFNREGTFLAASQITLEALAPYGSKDFSIPFSKELALYVPPQTPQIPSFPRNLLVGMSGDDVLSLQDVLNEQGILDRTPTGYYDMITAQGVSTLQAKLNVSSTGELDELTRRALVSFLQSQVPYVPQDTQLGAVDTTRTKIFVEAR